MAVLSHAVSDLGKTQFFLSLKLHLNQSGADQFCRTQYGGSLASKAQTQAAHALFSMQSGQLPSTADNMLWIQRSGE